MGIGDIYNSIRTQSAQDELELIAGEIEGGTERPGMSFQPLRAVKTVHRLLKIRTHSLNRFEGVPRSGVQNPRVGETFGRIVVADPSLRGIYDVLFESALRVRVWDIRMLQERTVTLIDKDVVLLQE